MSTTYLYDNSPAADSCCIKVLCVFRCSVVYDDLICSVQRGCILNAFVLSNPVQIVYRINYVDDCIVISVNYV